MLFWLCWWMLMFGHIILLLNHEFQTNPRFKAFVMQEWKNLKRCSIELRFMTTIAVLFGLYNGQVLGVVGIMSCVLLRYNMTRIFRPVATEPEFLYLYCGGIPEIPESIVSNYNSLRDIS